MASRDRNHVIEFSGFGVRKIDGDALQAIPEPQGFARAQQRDRNGRGTRVMSGAERPVLAWRAGARCRIAAARTSQRAGPSRQWLT